MYLQEEYNNDQTKVNGNVIPSFEYIDGQALEDAKSRVDRQRSFKCSNKQGLSNYKRNSKSYDELNRNDCKLII